MGNRRQTNLGVREVEGFRLLCVGDIHLGRRPGKLPAGLVDYGIGVADLTPVAAWRATVSWAIDNGVDAVVLTGDVIESLEDRFEAFGHLERGVRELAEAGIEVVGVAGNHDVQALPSLARRIESFKLLGAGGKWESHELRGCSGVELRLLGWSFPELAVRRNPLDDLDEMTLRRLREGPTTIGVLHCDVDAVGSPYAPVPRRAFDSAPGAAWLLGHVHKPDQLGGSRPVGYLGSLVGLDPGEPGLHGPWLAVVTPGGQIDLTQLALAPLRWERAEVSVDGLSLGGSSGEGRSSLEDELAGLVYSALEDIHLDIGEGLGATRVVGCRLRLTGRCERHAELRECLERGELAAQVLERDRVVYFIEKIVDDAAPAFDLERLAQGGDPPALLARRLIALRNGGAEAERLLDAAAARVEASARPLLRGLGRDEAAADREALRELLIGAGMEALEKLLAQKDRADPDRGADR